MDTFSRSYTENHFQSCLKGNSKIDKKWPQTFLYIKLVRLDQYWQNLSKLVKIDQNQSALTKID